MPKISLFLSAPSPCTRQSMTWILSWPWSKWYSGCSGASNKFSCFDSLRVYKNRPNLEERTGSTNEPTAPVGKGKVNHLHIFRFTSFTTFMQFGPVIHRYGSRAVMGDVDQTFAAVLRENDNFLILVFMSNNI